MIPLFREYLAARRLMRGGNSRDPAAALQACGLPADGYGIAFVAIDPHNYAPADGGKPAIIVPLFQDGALLDLIATGLETRASRTRAGIGTVLGRDWLDRAKDTETALRLFADPIEWLRNGCRGAVVIDWRAARYELADLPGIACENEMLAARVERALKRPTRLPQLFVREARHAA